MRRTQPGPRGEEFAGGMVISCGQKFFLQLHSGRPKSMPDIFVLLFYTAQPVIQKRIFGTRSKRSANPHEDKANDEGRKRTAECQEAQTRKG